MHLVIPLVFFICVGLIIEAIVNAGEYLGSCQTSVMELFAKVANAFCALTIFAKKFHLRFLKVS